MSSKHPGRQTEFAKFRRNMARLEYQLAQEKAEHQRDVASKDKAKKLDK